MLISVYWYLYTVIFVLKFANIGVKFRCSFVFVNACPYSADHRNPFLVLKTGQKITSSVAIGSVQDESWLIRPK